MSGSPFRKTMVVLTLWSTAALADAPLAVLVLGAPPPAAAPVPVRPGQIPVRPGGAQMPARSSPGLMILVDGQAAVMVDPASGSLGAAQGQGQALSGVGAVLLTSMRPEVTAELPVFLTDLAPQTATLRLLGPGGGGRWPGTARWAEALFGSSGLYRTAGARIPRLSVEEVRSERRATLPGRIELRARAVPGADGPASAHRLSRDGASVVLAGDVAPAAARDLTVLADRAGLLVASVPTMAAVRALAQVMSSAKVGAALITAAGEEVRADPEGARRLIGAAAVPVTWTSSGTHPVAGLAPPGADEVDGGCTSDAQCGPGQVCMGCGGDSPRTCVAGCRSKTDCPAGQSCLQVQCVRCPCPAICSGGK